MATRHWLIQAVVENPTEFSEGITAFGTAVFGLVVVFHIVTWSADQVAQVAVVGTLILRALAWLFLRRFMTARANPTTHEGVPLAPVKPATRGIPKA